MSMRRYWKVPDTEVTYKEAVTMARFWWNRYRDLPWWRFFSKREARECAEVWGMLSKRLHTTEPLLDSEHVQSPRQPKCTR